MAKIVTSTCPWLYLGILSQYCQRADLPRCVTCSMACVPGVPTLCWQWGGNWNLWSAYIVAEDLDGLAIPSRGTRPYCRFMQVAPLGFLLITAMVWYVKMWIQHDRSRWQVRTPAIGFTLRKSIRLGNLGARAVGVNGLWLCGRVSASATRPSSAQSQTMAGDCQIFLIKFASPWLSPTTVATELLHLSPTPPVRILRMTLRVSVSLGCIIRG